jgi:hypothetical protein
MILIVEVAISGSSSGDGDSGRGRGGSNNRNSRNGDNGDGSSRNSIDWEVEWIRAMDGEEMMSAAVELGMGVTVEDI